jgi:hypothetical protein
MAGPVVATTQVLRPVHGTKLTTNLNHFIPSGASPEQQSANPENTLARHRERGSEAGIFSPDFGNPRRPPR